MENTKLCTKCNTAKDLKSFTFRKDRNKHSTICRECSSLYQKQHYQENKIEKELKRKEYRSANRDMILERERQYRVKNKERIKLNREKYEKENKEQILQKRREYVKANKTKIAEVQKKYHAENREYLLSRHRLYYYANAKQLLEKNKIYRKNNSKSITEGKRKYYNDNKSTILEKAKTYRMQNKEKISAFLKKYRKTKAYKISKKNSEHKRRTITKNGDVTTSQLTKLINNSKECYWCKCKLKGNYHIDHYLPLSKGGAHTISNLVISCPPCNLSKNSKDPYLFALEKGKLF